MRPPSFILQPDLITSWLFYPESNPLCANSRNFIRDIPRLCACIPRGRPSIKSRFFNRSGRASKGSLRKPS